MSKAAELHRFYLVNMACGDISESEQARMLAEIAAADDMAKARIMAGPRHLRRSTHPWPTPLQIEFVKHNDGREQTPGHHATPEV